MLFRSSDTEAQESEQYYTSSTLGSGNSGNNQMSTSAYLVAVTVTLHALLWSSSFVLVSTIYLFLSGVVGGSIQVPEILMLVSVCLGLSLFSSPFPSDASYYRFRLDLCAVRVI